MCHFLLTTYIVVSDQQIALTIQQSVMESFEKFSTILLKIFDRNPSLAQLPIVVSIILKKPDHISHSMIKGNEKTKNTISLKQFQYPNRRNRGQINIEYRAFGF